MKLATSSILTFAFIQLVFTSCNQNVKQSAAIDKKDTLDNINSTAKSDTKSKDSLTTFSNIEKRIIDTIFKLREVKERANYIDQQTKGKRHLQMWIADTPNIKQPYYYIQVGEDNGTNFVTHFNFFVYPDYMRIIYLDTVNDDTLTLKQWRKINGM